MRKSVVCCRPLPLAGQLPRLLLDSVVLEVPLSDFAAIYSAATRGPAWRSGAQHSAPLMSQVSNFTAASFDHSMVTLSLYEGWGWRGTNVTFVPLEAVPLGFDLLGWEAGSGAAGAGASRDGSGSEGANIGLGLGLGLGLGVPTAVLLIGLAVVCALVRVPQGSGSIKPVVGVKVL